MIILKSVTIRNFLSVGQNTQAVDLYSSGLTLVLGKNADIGATNARNGVGKSTLIQAVCYALYGEPLTNIRIGNLINLINQKAMLVTITFERDGKSYRIERGRKPNLLRFLVNDKEIEADSDDAQGENKHTQKAIDDVLGMSHTLFKHLVALNTFTEPFLRMKPASQREVIEELFGIMQISARDEALTKLITATKTVIREEDIRIAAQTEANARIMQAVERAKQERDAWAARQSAKMALLAAEHDALEQIDFESELAVFDRIDGWMAAEREYKAARLSHLAETETLTKALAALGVEIKRQRAGTVAGREAHIARLRAEVARCDAEALKTPDSQIARLLGDAARRDAESAKTDVAVSQKEQELVALLGEIENADGHSCSTCGQGLDGTDHLATVMRRLADKAETISGEIDHLRQTGEKLRQEADDIRTEIDHVRQTWADKQVEWQEKAKAVRLEIIEAETQQVSESKQIAAKVADLEAEQGELEMILFSRQTELSSLDADFLAVGKKPVSDYRSREEIWTLRQSKENMLADLEREAARENPHDTQIKSLESTVQDIDYTRLHDAQDTLKHQDFLHKLLSGKDSFIRKKIIDQNLSFLNSRMNKYLEALALPHEVTFLPDLSVNISILGRELDFEQLSRGEMNRVILATSWSFRDIWESTNTSLNLCFVDELLDSGMDQAGAEAGLDVLNRMVRDRGKNVFLISHNESLIGRVNRILMVHKSNQFTSFEDNAEIG